MRVPFSVGQVLGAAATLALVAGCSSGTPTTNTTSSVLPSSVDRQSAGPYRPMVNSDGVMSVLPASFKPNLQRPSWMKAAPAFAATRTAVAQFGASNVLWFWEYDRQNHPPTVCEPASSTNGIRIDTSGNLWVPDGRANTTTEYAPNCGAAKLTINDATGEPADVGFDNKNHVYILNINNHNGPPTVGVYTAAGKRIGTLGDPSFNSLFGVGADARGNVFVSNLTTGNVGNVVEFAGGKMPGKQLSGVSLGLPGAPAFDSSNNLIISDWLRMTIDVFAPPYKNAPTTSTLQGQSIWCPLDHGGKHIFCGDAQNGSIDVYGYPGGAYLYSFTAGLSANNLVTGVAPDPPAPW